MLLFYVVMPLLLVVILYSPLGTPRGAVNRARVPPLYINGEFVHSVSKRTFESFNPFDRQVVGPRGAGRRGRCPQGRRFCAQSVDEGPWRSFSNEHRSALIKAVADKITDGKTISNCSSGDSGSTIRKQRERIYLSARAMAYFSKLAATNLTEPIEASPNRVQPPEFHSPRTRRRGRGYHTLEFR